MVIRELLTHWGFTADTRKLKAWGRQLKSAEKVAKKVSVAVGGALAAMVLPAAQVESNIARALTIAGQPVEAFEKNRDKLAKLAMDLGDDLSMSANQVSDSYYAVLSTGAKVTEQSFETLAREGLKFAKVGFIETAEAVEFMDGTLKSFNLDSSEASRVTDVMQKTTFLAATNIAQLTEAMKTAAPVSAGLNIEIEETSAVLAGFADKLIKGGEAGNALKRILARIKNEGGPAEEALQKLGIEAFDAQGNFIGLIELLEQLQQKTKDLTQEQRAKALLKIAGQYGEAPLSALLQTDMEKLREFEKELQDAGGAVDAGLAQLKRSGPETFKSMWEAGKNFLMVFGFVVMDILKPVAEELTKIAIGLRRMAQNYPWIAKLAAGILLVVGSISMLTLVVVKLTLAMKVLQWALLKPFLLVAAKVALAIAAIATLYLIIEDLVAFFTGNESLIGDFFEAIVWWANYAIRNLKVKWLEFKLWFIKMWDDITGTISKKVSAVMDPVKDFFQDVLPYQSKVTQEPAALNSGGRALSSLARIGEQGVNTNSTTTNSVTVPVTIQNAKGLEGAALQTEVNNVVSKTVDRLVRESYVNFQPVVQQ